MILKFLGVVGLFISGVLLGNRVSRQYNEKVRFWRYFEEFILFFYSEIQYSRNDLESILEQFKKRKNLFFDILYGLIQYNTISTFLSEEENEFILSISINIKTLDSDTLQNHLQETEQEIKKRIQNAEKNYEKYGKLYAKLLPILSIGIAILLL